MTAEKTMDLTIVELFCVVVGNKQTSGRVRSQQNCTPS